MRGRIGCNAGGRGGRAPGSRPSTQRSAAQRGIAGSRRGLHLAVMPRTISFRTTLVSGTKRPYASWTFLIIPPDVARDWGPGQKPVRGTISGHPFRGTASRGEGALRVPIPRDFRELTGLGLGDTVEAALELDAAARPVQLPDELRALFTDDPEVAALYDKLPPSHRRAWATYVAGAKRPETRLRRARRARDGIHARDYPR